MFKLVPSATLQYSKLKVPNYTLSNKNQDRVSPINSST